MLGDGVGCWCWCWVMVLVLVTNEYNSGGEGKEARTHVTEGIVVQMTWRSGGFDHGKGSG